MAVIPHLEDKISGIILAGEKSSRFGQDKAFVEFQSRPWIEILVDKLKKMFSEILIVTNQPHKFHYLKLSVISDLIKNKGPLGGIYTGLYFSKNLFGKFRKMCYIYYRKERGRR